MAPVPLGQSNVREELPGHPWKPKGGEFVVLSFLPDDYDGRIEAGAGPDFEGTADRPVERPVSNEAEASVVPIVALSLEAMRESGVSDLLTFVRTLRGSQERRRAFFGRIHRLALEEHLTQEAGSRHPGDDSSEADG